MADHVDVTSSSVVLIDLSGSTATARGVDGPSGAKLCAVYAPADSACVFQVGTGIEDGTTDIATGGPIPPRVWTAIPCSVSEAPGAESGRPTLYFQGDANVHVRFTAGGLG